MFKDVQDLLHLRQVVEADCEPEVIALWLPDPFFADERTREVGNSGQVGTTQSQQKLYSGLENLLPAVREEGDKGGMETDMLYTKNALAQVVPEIVVVLPYHVLEGLTHTRQRDHQVEETNT